MADQVSLPYLPSLYHSGGRLFCFAEVHLSVDFDLTLRGQSGFPFFKSISLFHVLTRGITKLSAINHFDIICSFTLVPEMEEIKSIEVEFIINKLSLKLRFLNT